MLTDKEMQTWMFVALDIFRTCLWHWIFFRAQIVLCLYMRCDLRDSSTEQRHHADWMECICWQASNQATRSTYRRWVLAQHLAIYVYVLLFGVPYFTDLGRSYFPRAERLPFFSYQRPCTKEKIFQIILFLQRSQMGKKKTTEEQSSGQPVVFECLWR